MNDRLLSGLNVSTPALALGTWAMGGYAPSWGAVDDNESIATIQQALDLGVKLFDSAPIYGYGHSEEVLGKAIQGRRDECLIATKCGLLPSPQSAKVPIRCLKYDNVVRECEASLRRLKLEVIDLYQCHWPDPETPIGETMEAMLSLLNQGRIRAIGLSNYSIEEIAEARKHGPVHSLQISFSMIDRHAAAEILPYCAANGISVLVYSPLSKGLLTGKFREDSEITGIRATDAEFQGTRFRANLAKVARLKGIAGKYDRTMAQLALNWVCSQPGVTCALFGAKRPSQVMENLGALGWSISPTDAAEIDRILEEP